MIDYTRPSGMNDKEFRIYIYRNEVKDFMLQNPSINTIKNVAHAFMKSDNSYYEVVKEIISYEYPQYIHILEKLELLK